jgi:hypothetical protein
MSHLVMDSITFLKTLDSVYIDSLVCVDSTKINMASNKGFKVRVWDTSSINGITGKLNYYFASTPPTVARLYLPAAKTVSYTDWSHINSVGYLVTANNGSNFDGGNNINFLWPSAGRRRGSGGLNISGGLIISTAD